MIPVMSPLSNFWMTTSMAFRRLARRRCAISRLRSMERPRSCTWRCRRMVSYRFGLGYGNLPPHSALNRLSKQILQEGWGRGRVGGSVCVRVRTCVCVCVCACVRTSVHACVCLQICCLQNVYVCIQYCMCSCTHVLFMCALVIHVQCVRVCTHVCTQPHRLT